jgi:toxin YhaV
MAQAPQPLIVNGWRIYLHAQFLDQYEGLFDQVELLRQADQKQYKKKKEAKLLAAITSLIFHVIPEDPSRPEYRQGDTLSSQCTNWFRAKLFQQYRLFFRYETKYKVIIYACINDDDNLRAYGSKKDAYKTFAKMLNGGKPPSE